MKNEPKKNDTVIPVVIIGLVLVGVVGGGWWLYSQSKPAINSSDPLKPTASRTPSIPTNAPAGANPPIILGSPNANVTVE
jgi:hypothetical protein